MIIWINGAFGSGKSSVAYALQKKIPGSFIYDPEQFGYFLWDNFPDTMKRKGNFQHINIWREGSYKILKYIQEHYSGILIVPMTLYIKQYYEEIVQRLVQDEIPLKHFILCASKQTILNRLKQRGESSDSWGAQHIDTCLHAFDSDISEIKIVTDSKSVDEIASEIISLSGLSL